PVPSTSLQPGSIGFGSLSNAAADFGARSMLLAVRSLAKNLRGIPGRKMVILFSGGFPTTTENQSELTATISACNQANVAIYALDARGLVAGGRPIASNTGPTPASRASAHAVASRSSDAQPSSRPRLILASFSSETSQSRGGGGAPGGGSRGGAT